MDGKQSLLDLATALADGRPVDWVTAARSMTTDDDRRLLDELRFISGLTPRPGDASRLSSGESWGPLRIIQHVGRGTFGDVYRAWDSRLDREVALKILRPSEHDDQAHASTVIQEGRLLARVRHPNVVTVYGAERIGGQIGVWMEFVHGNTLEQDLQDHGPFAVERVVRIGIELSGALATVHRAGLIHGDVKAQNVLCDGDGRLVLMDFGSGIELKERPNGAACELAGTPLCVAPEVLAGQAASAQSDLYSLAVLLYHLLTRSYPVRGRSLRDVREAHAKGARRPLRQVRPDLRRDLVGIIDRALDPDPAARHATIEMWHAELRQLASTGWSARSAVTPPAGRRGKGALVVVVLLAIVGAGSLALWRSSATAANQAGEIPNVAVPLTAAPRVAQNFGIIEFPGATRTDLFEINDNGVIVGSYVDRHGTTHGFLLSDGSFRTIEAPGAVRTGARGLNNQGTVVGDYTDGAGIVHGFVLHANAFRVIDVPGATQTRANAVNGAGTVAGDYRDGKGDTHGFSFDGDAFTRIDVPGGISTRPVRLDDQGRVVGDYRDSARRQHGFLFVDNRFTTIDVPGARITQALGLNAQGAIVGRYETDSAIVRGFLFSRGEFISIDVPGAARTQAIAINASGAIVGTYFGGEPLRTRGFLLTP